MTENEPRDPADAVYDTNDFDIVEHFSDDEDDAPGTDPPQPTYHSRGFPEATHRTKSDLNLANPPECQDSIIKPLEEMSIAEIQEAQKYLEEKLGKETCEFIRQRKLKK